MVEFSPISSSGEVQEASGVGSVKKTKQASGSKTIKMVPDNQKPEQEVKATNALKSDIKNGNALYNETGPFGAIGTLVDKGRVDNEIILSGFPKDTTLGDVRKKYNLPVGSLRHLVTSGGGNFDSYKVSELDGPVYIFADDMQKGLGVSADELKEMFPEKQFSPWNKFGTKK